jgi:hypothetical protein
MQVVLSALKLMLHRPSTQTSFLVNQNILNSIRQ